MIKKLMLMPFLFGIACLFAGSFGAIHNQISYSVSNEYFTQFKFEQFRISDSVPDRIGAAIVGWKASWWMGIVIGVVLIPAGLVIRDPGSYFKTTAQVFGVVVATTTVVGLAALAYAYLAITEQSAGEVTRYGNEITNDVAFMRAGTMHDFSYLGGMLGIISGVLYIYRCCCHQTDELKRVASEAAND